MIKIEIGEPIPLIYKEDNFQLHILFDGNTPFTFGTKLRKAEGLYHSILNQGYSAIQLVGDPNSNYLAAFTFYFYTKKIPVFGIHISRSGYRSGNRILSERFSTSFLNVSRYEDSYFSCIHPAFQKIYSIKYPEEKSRKIFATPRWGISSYSIENIQKMTNNILNLYKIYTIYIDIGSGFTYLSFLNHIKLRNVRVVGVCIGLKKEKMVSYLNRLEFQLFGKTSEYQLLDAIGDRSFGKIRREDISLIEKLREKGVYLDPIYSVKSFKTILEIEKSSCREGIYYLHQGGLLPGINRVR